jgi:monoamine oxidase
MQDHSAISRRNVVKAMGAATLLAGTAGPGALRAQNHSKVLVIGAGLSGLYTALLLQEAGLEVQVIEGRDRVGGRVLSHRNLPGSPESGGTSFGAGYARVIDLCRRLDIGLIDTTPLVPFFFQRELVLRGERIAPADWPNHPRNPLPADAREMMPLQYISGLVSRNNPLKNADGWTDPANAAYDVSLHQWLAAQGASEELIELGWNTNITHGTSAHDVSALMILFVDMFTRTQAQLGKDVFGYTAVGGNQAITEAMAGALKKEIHFNRDVRAISSDDRGGEVHCADGSRYQADWIVCSIPFSVLRRIKIDPLVKGRQGRAINTLASQPVNLLHLAISEPFWEQDGLQPNMFTDSLAGMVVAERKGGDVRDISSMTLWVRGRHATWMDTLDEPAAIATIMEDFYRLRPAARGKVEVAAYKSWYRDPFSAGDWCYWQPGQVSGFAADVARPHGRMHFCGEHTAVSNRGMEGAMESGERAALEILSLA